MDKHSYQSIEDMNIESHAAGSGAGGSTPAPLPRLKGTGKKLLLAAAAVVLLAAVVSFGLKLFGGREKEEQEYSIVDEWSSRDLLNMEDLFVEILETQAGLSHKQAGMVSELLGFDDEESVISFWFTSSGVIHLSISGLAIGADHLSYEVLDEETMLLRFEWSVAIAGTTIPIDISYVAGYKVQEKRLTLDFFGYEAKFDRVE